MQTNAQLITRLYQAVKDTDRTRPKRSAATYAAILTEAQEFINSELELCRREFTLTLTSGDGQYTLDDAFIQFPTDRLKEGSGLVYYTDGDLEPTSVERLNKDQAGWRDADAGVPEKFALEGVKSGSTSIFQIQLVPEPSAAFIVDFATLTYYGVYRPADIADNALSPFDSNAQYARLHRLLLLHALWTIELEDANPIKAAERWAKLVDEVDLARGWVPRISRSNKGLSFDRDWRS